MGDSYSRRYPRLALPALPRPDLAAALWRRQRPFALAALGPVLGVLLLLAGGLLAADQYASSKAEVRRAETGRYLAEFHEPPVADAWQRLSAAWQAEQDRQRRSCSGSAAPPAQRFEVAVRNYRDFVLDTVDDYRLAADIKTVHAFFVRLGTCIKVGSCDPAAAAAQLGPAVWQFRNQHYYYFALEGLAADFDRSALLIAPPAPGQTRRLKPQAQPAAGGACACRGSACASGGRSRRGS